MIQWTFYNDKGQVSSCEYVCHLPMKKCRGGGGGILTTSKVLKSNSDMLNICPGVVSRTQGQSVPPHPDDFVT